MQKVLKSRVMRYRLQITLLFFLVNGFQHSYQSRETSKIVKIKKRTLRW